MEQKTVAEVIEDHRQKVGAESVHVTLVDPANTDPAGLASALEMIREASRKMGLFREEERLAAKIGRLEDLIGKVNALSQNQSLAPEERLTSIFFETDMIIDHDLDADLVFMTEAREKRGEPLPADL